jgi:hypothetical protein
MTGPIRVAYAALCLVAVTACATGPRVGAHLEPGTDLSRFATYAWEPADLLPTGDPRLDGNLIFAARIQSAADRYLATKGLRKVEADRAELLIHYHVTVTERFDIYEVDRSFGYSSDFVPRVVQFEEGTLIFDIVEAATNKVVWRGWAQDEVRPGILNDQAALERAVDSAVAQIFSRFM